MLMIEQLIIIFFDWGCIAGCAEDKPIAANKSVYCSAFNLMRSARNIDHMALQPLQIVRTIMLQLRVPVIDEEHAY